MATIKESGNKGVEIGEELEISSVTRSRVTLSWWTLLPLKLSARSIGRTYGKLGFYRTPTCGVCYSLGDLFWPERQCRQFFALKAKDDVKKVLSFKAPSLRTRNMKTISKVYKQDILLLQLETRFPGSKKNKEGKSRWYRILSTPPGPRVRKERKAEMGAIGGVGLFRCVFCKLTEYLEALHVFKRSFARQNHPGERILTPSHLFTWIDRSLN